MQQKIWKWVSLIIILIIVVKFVIPSIWNETKAVTQTESSTLDSEIAEHILRTSVQITMMKDVSDITEAQDDSNQNKRVKVFKETYGLGTLVSHEGEILLISHNHWSLFNDSTTPDKVAFRNSEGSLLLEMSGTELLSLILFQDSGTLIIIAPKKLTAKAFSIANMGDFETLSPGDIVHVVHHSPEQEERISILPAEIVGHEMRDGVPVISLRSLNGQSIEPGDSGGGIWVNGYLAGNMWKTIREVRQSTQESDSPDRNETVFSLAAGLPVELIDLVEAMMLAQTPPSLEMKELSW